MTKRLLSSGWVIPTGLIIVAMVMLALRWEQTGSRVLEAPRDVVLLTEAMSADEDGPVTMADLARLSALHEEAVGVEARSLARLARQAGQTELAERWLQAGAASVSDPNLTLFELCRLYWDQGEINEALSACAGSRSSAAYWLNRGYEAADAAQTTEAINLFAMAATTDPSNVEAWHQLGRAYFAEQRFGDAIQALQQQMTLDPQPTVSVYRTLGEAHYQEGDLVAARNILEQGLRAFPGDRQQALMLATVLRDDNELEAAAAQYAELAERYPQTAAVWAGWGDVALATGNPREAVNHTQRAVQLQPDDAGYWLQLVDAATVAGRPALVQQAYEELMLLRPSDVVLWLKAGEFYLEAGQIDAVQRVLEHVLVLDPGNERAARLQAALAESNLATSEGAVQSP